jgi:hypothetical protein
MVKRMPHVLDDLLFHTAPDKSREPSQEDHPVASAERPCDPLATWTRPAWDESDQEAQMRVALHTDRLAWLRDYAARHNLALRDVVDRALSLLLFTDDSSR